MLLTVRPVLHGEQHTEQHMGNPLSPEQAAKRAGLSRWTISRALQAGKLRGIRDNRGRWRVETDDLDAWLAEHPPTLHAEQHSEQPALHTVQHTEHHGLPAEQERHVLTTEIAVLRTRLEAVEGRATELALERDEARTDRDRWRVMAEHLVERETERPAKPPVEARPRSGFLARLLGLDRTRSA